MTDTIMIEKVNKCQFLTVSGQLTVQTEELFSLIYTPTHISNTLINQN